jgi:cytochrome c-type biogenesis protein CcmE
MKRILNRWVLCAVAAGTIACSGGSTAQPPASPSALAQPAAGVASNVAHGSSIARSNIAQLEGPLSSLAGSCPALTFNVDGNAVSTTASTRFVGPTCSQLTSGAAVTVSGTLQNGAVVAAEVHSRVPTVQVRGPLSGLQGTCPAVTFMLDRTTVSTAAGTHFDGETCAQLTNGTNVVVNGTLQNGSVVAADVQSRVIVVQVRGTVTGLGGGCPAVTFTVDRTTVSTTASTRFVGDACAQLSNGTSVIVEGVRQDGGVVAADVVSRH